MSRTESRAAGGAQADLKEREREQLEYERRTVFQEMLERERYTQNAHLKEALHPWQLRRKWAVKGFKLTAFLALFLGLWLGPPLFKSVEQNNCFALLVYVSLMWAFEVRCRGGWGGGSLPPLPCSCWRRPRLWWPWFEQYWSPGWS